METTITNALQVFSNEELNANVRVFVENGEPLFVATDVCKGLNITTEQVRRLDDDEKGLRLIQTPGGQQNMSVVNESGLYNLILGSRKKEAKQFKRWITHDVLPSIRKNGKYELQNETDEQLIARALIAANSIVAKLQNRVDFLEERIAVRDQQIAEMNPKIAYYDMILNNKGLTSITTIAKDYGISGRELNKILHMLGIQWKQNKTWVLYQKYAEQGYTSTKTETYQDSNGTYQIAVNTYWTQKGRLFLYETLKDVGIIPNIERQHKIDAQRLKK